MSSSSSLKERPESNDNHKKKPCLSDFVRISFNVYAMTGVRLFDCGEKERNPRFRRFIFTITVVIVIVNFITKILFLIFDLDKLTTSLERVALIIYWSFPLNSLAKMICVWLGRKELASVYARMLLRFPINRHDRNEYRSDEYYAKSLKYNKGITVANLCTTAMFNTFPFMQSCWDYLSGHQFGYRLPFIMSYPFDERQPFTYFLAYSLQMSGACAAAYFYLGSDLLLITSLHLINMHLECLAKKIRSFKPSGNDGDLMTLRGFLAYHEEILKYSEHVDNVFSVPILLNYVSTCLMICCIGLQIVSGTELLDLVKFLSFLLSTLAHVYVISVFSTDMISLSNDISDAFFVHQWYFANVDYQRMLVLPLARAQRPAHITAFKFFIISMESFKTLVTTSYQFFTLIQARM